TIPWRARPGGRSDVVMIDTAGRASEIEIMDSGGYDESEIRENLADLRFFNTWFGGARLIARAVEGLVPRGPEGPQRLTVIAVAPGSAATPAYLVGWFASRGVDLLAEGIDSNDDMLLEARRYLDELKGAGAAAARRVRLTRADACSLPHPDESVDVTVCSDFLHHLDTTKAVAA